MYVYDIIMKYTNKEGELSETCEQFQIENGKLMWIDGDGEPSPVQSGRAEWTYSDEYMDKVFTEFDERIEKLDLLKLVDSMDEDELMISNDLFIVRNEFVSSTPANSHLPY
ncbi:hypothetical protein [uncultured Methanobrevibacter sp.]|uniref:hypothetical protein n=1 Tax=uncultured Methanobrevibacter sp. TaxID=253161 RepID=UPI002610A178|nr:hypothetical protein [uncultured Methanobrevibacter sp.]